MQDSFYSKSLSFLCLALILHGCTPSVPDYCGIREANAEYDQCKLDDNVFLPARPLELGDVVEIALCRNLDVQLQKIEQCVQSQNYVAEKLNQLPELTVNYEVQWRDNTPAWFSRPVGGKKDDVATQSTERSKSIFDLTAAFNIIDFGLTYIKTRQEQSRALLLEQRHLRARQNLILDLYGAYFRALVAKSARDQAKQLISELSQRHKGLEHQMKKQLISELRELDNENRLIDMEMRLHAFENEYQSSMKELASLMGLPPGRHFEIADVQLSSIQFPEIDTDHLEHMALRYRPELFAQDMQSNIEVDEVKASLLQMFPHVRVFSGWWYDSDDFQFHNNWINVGAHISWDLLTLPSKMQHWKASQFRQNLAENNRLTISMGVLTQVHLAYINVREMKQQYDLSKELLGVKKRQLEVSKQLEFQGQLDLDDLLAMKAEVFYAEVNAYKAYGNLEIALEQLSNAIGRPLFFSSVEEECLPYQVEECCPVQDCLVQMVPAREEFEFFEEEVSEPSVEEEIPFRVPFLQSGDGANGCCTDFCEDFWQ